MPWKASSVMEERLRFVARLLDGEAMTDVCREFGISRKTGYKIFDRYPASGCGEAAVTCPRACGAPTIPRAPRFKLALASRSASRLAFPKSSGRHRDAVRHYDDLDGGIDRARTAGASGDPFSLCDHDVAGSLPQRSNAPAPTGRLPGSRAKGPRTSRAAAGRKRPSPSGKRLPGCSPAARWARKATTR